MSYSMRVTTVRSRFGTKSALATARREPSGDQMGVVAFKPVGVTRSRLAPSASTTNTAALNHSLPGSGDIACRSKAMRLPSGDHRGHELNPSHSLLLGHWSIPRLVVDV